MMGNPADEVDIKVIQLRIMRLGELPALLLGFQITNRSQLDIELERMLITIYIGGQPTVWGSMLRRTTIPRRRAVSDDSLQLWFALSEGQIAQVKAVRQGDSLALVNVDVLAYFDSRLSRITVKAGSGSENVRVTGIP